MKNLIQLCILYSMTVFCFGALNANIVWEVRQGGNNNNGGGFKTGASGTDRTLATTAYVTLSTLSTVNATTNIIDVHASDHTPDSTDVGNVLQITGGTATAGFYEITASGSGQWTLDRSAGTSTQTVVGSMGGALGWPFVHADSVVAGNITYVKADAQYDMTTTTVNSAGGPLNTSVSGAVNNEIFWIGYNTDRSKFNTDTKPVISANAQANFTMVALDTQMVVFHNIELNGQGNANVKGFHVSNSYNGVQWCRVQNATDNAFHMAGDYMNCVFNEAVGSGTDPAFNISSRSEFYGCIARDGTTSGFLLGAGLNVIRCASYNNSGANSNGFEASSVGFRIINCMAYNNGNHGFSASGNAEYNSFIMNCLSEKNGDEGYYSDADAKKVIFINNGAYDNSTSNYTESRYGFASGNFTASTGTFFTDPTANPPDFSLNNTAGNGAAARAAGYDFGYEGGATSSAIDSGISQHADPASSGGEHSYGFAG